MISFIQHCGKDHTRETQDITVVIRGWGRGVGGWKGNVTVLMLVMLLTALLKLAEMSTKKGDFHCMY